MLSHIAWLILQPLNFFLATRGLENIQDLKRQGIVLVSNHIGVTDPWRIGSLLPFHLGGVYWLSAVELFSFKEAFCLFSKDTGKIRAFFIASFSVILVNFSLTLPVDRSSTNRKAISQVSKLLKNNNIVGIFPEGGLDRKGEANSVFVRLAMKTNSVILPVKITKNKVIFGSMIDVAVADKKEAKKIAADIMAGIYKL